MTTAEFEVLHLLASKNGVDSDIFFIFWAKWQARDVKNKTHIALQRPSTLAKLEEMKESLIKVAQPALTFTYRPTAIFGTPAPINEGPPAAANIPVDPQAIPAETALAKYIFVEGVPVRIANQRTTIDGVRGRVVETGHCYYSQTDEFEDPGINAYYTVRHGTNYTLDEFNGHITDAIYDSVRDNINGDFNHYDYECDNQDVDYETGEDERNDAIMEAFGIEITTEGDVTVNQEPDRLPVDDVMDAIVQADEDDDETVPFEDEEEEDDEVRIGDADDDDEGDGFNEGDTVVVDHVGTMTFGTMTFGTTGTVAGGDTWVFIDEAAQMVPPETPIDQINRLFREGMNEGAPEEIVTRLRTAAAIAPI